MAKKRRYFVFLVSFRIRMYLWIANEISGQMVKRAGISRRGPAKETEENRMAKEVGRKPRGSQHGSYKMCFKEQVFNWPESCSELNQIKSGKNPLVPATWRSTVTLGGLLAGEASEGRWKREWVGKESWVQTAKNLLWEGMGWWLEGK